MDNGSFNVVYLDRRAPSESAQEADNAAARNPGRQVDGASVSAPADAGFVSDLAALTSVFSRVHVRTSVASCVKACAGLGKSLAAGPTVIVIQTTHEDTRTSRSTGRLDRSSSPKSVRNRGGQQQQQQQEEEDEEDLCGLSLLHKIQDELRMQTASTVCIPVVALGGSATKLSVHGSLTTDAFYRPNPWSSDGKVREEINISSYLDAGAADVIAAPLTRDRLLALPPMIYRTAKESTRRASLFAADRARKKSWCGFDNDPRPYAYLREAMVSSLMAGICNSESVDQDVDASTFYVSPARKQAVEQAVGTWPFSAHDFDEDELVYAILTILKHTLGVSSLQKWRLDDDGLISFLLATRKVYNSFVLYHNFRHACDVTQALFYFLIQIQALPRYPDASAAAEEERPSKTPLAAILDPFHALTMLIAAIGHDVGHPGVNNLFLVTLNAPLAQLYSDRSVLECFHCAAYTQILRRYWPMAFSDTSMRKFMVNAILATDMGVHAKYVDSLKLLQDELSRDAKAPETYSSQTIEENRDLLCCLMIKCADICNAARPIDIATRWAGILIDEFANQGDMEKELNIPTCLYGGPPVRNDVSKLAMSQIGFMDMFAIPLFGSMTSVFPSMQFAVDELRRNRKIWERRIEEAQSSTEAPRASLTGLERIPTFARHGEAGADGPDMARHRKSEPSPRVSSELQLTSEQARAGDDVPDGTGRAANGAPRLPKMNFDSSRKSSLGQFMSKRSDSGRLSGQSNLSGVPPSAAMDSVRQLDGAQPEIHSPPPHSNAGERDSEAGKVPYMTSAVRSSSAWTESAVASEKQEGLLAAASSRDDQDSAEGASTERVTSATSGTARSTKPRKTSGLSLRFWKKKKNRSVDSILNCGSAGGGSSSNNTPRNG